MSGRLPRSLVHFSIAYSLTRSLAARIASHGASRFHSHLRSQPAAALLCEPSPPSPPLGLFSLGRFLSLLRRELEWCKWGRIAAKHRDACHCVRPHLRRSAAADSNHFHGARNCVRAAPPVSPVAPRGHSAADESHLQVYLSACSLPRVLGEYLLAPESARRSHIDFPL